MLLFLQVFQPDGEPDVGLQLLSHVLLLGRHHGPHPLPRLLRSGSETIFFFFKPTPKHGNNKFNLKNVKNLKEGKKDDNS